MLGDLKRGKEAVSVLRNIIVIIMKKFLEIGKMIKSMDRR